MKTKTIIWKLVVSRTTEGITKREFCQRAASKIVVVFDL